MEFFERIKTIHGADASYVEERLRPIGITQSMRSFPSDAVGGEMDYFYPDANGNLVIRYPSVITNGPQVYLVKTRKDEVQRPVERIRFRPGLEREAADGRLMKYQTPAGAASPIFIPRNTLILVRQGGKSDVLFVTEGELKAAAADRHGLPIVAVPGIFNHGKDPKAEGRKVLDDAFRPELMECIKRLGVKKLCFIYDSDLFDLQKDAEDGCDPTSRPRAFFRSARRFQERAEAAGVQPWIAWPEPGDRKLGLDDLILELIGEAPPELAVLGGIADEEDGDVAFREGTAIAKAVCQAVGWDWRLTPGEGPATLAGIKSSARWAWRGRDIARSILAAVTGTGKPVAGMRFVKIDGMADIQLREVWGLHSPAAFLERNAPKMAAWETFLWGKDRYLIKDGKVELEIQERAITIDVRGNQTFSVVNGLHRLVAGFVFLPKWRLKGGREGYIIDFRTHRGETESMLLSDAELTSLALFKKRMINKGMAWEGTDAELMRVNASVVVQAPVAEVVDTLGWDPARRHWAWANAVWRDGELYRPDDDGFVQLPDQHIMLPPSAKIFAGERGLDEERRVVHKAASKVTWRTWFDKAAKVYGVSKAVIAMAFVSSTVFADVIRASRRMFPLLFLFGPPQGGKTTFARSLQSFFGDPLPPRNMESGSTTAGLQRTFARYRQIPVFCDEASARTRPELMDILKNVFDGTGATQGVASGDNQTRSFAINATVIAASQHLPSHDPALVSRCVMIEFKPRGEARLQDKELMAELREVEEAGLSPLVHGLLQHRDLIEGNFRIAFLRMYGRILEMATESKLSQVTDRVIEIHAAMATPLAILASRLEGGRFMDENTIAACFCELLELHHAASSASDEVGNFFQIVQSAAIRRDVQYGEHYMIKDAELFIKWRLMHTAYKVECARTKDVPLPEATMKRYVQNHEAYIREDKVRFPGGSGPTTVLVIDISKLEVQFPNPYPNV